MRPKTERIARALTDATASWDSVDCVVLCESSEADIFDPYFALVLDVYYRGEIPAEGLRREAFGDPGAFEASSAQFKDRFFLEGLPVRVEYKDISSVEKMLDRKGVSVRLLKNEGTYVFYRLGHGTVLHSKSGWIDEARARLQTFPEAFWLELREIFQTKMEHHLADLGASVLSDDAFFYLSTTSGFSRFAAAALFAINKEFEPSHRKINQALLALGSLPAGFAGRWETFLRFDGVVSPAQKYEIAQLIAKSIIGIE